MRLAKSCRLARGTGASIILFIALVLSMLWAGLAYQLGRERSITIEAARTNSNNLARAYAEHVESVIASLDHLLLRLSVEYLHDPGGPGFAAALRREAANSPGTLRVALADASGTVTLASRPQHEPPATIGDRAYFRWHADHDMGEIEISEPIVDRINADSVITVSRRLNRPEGAFAGVVLASFSTEYLAGFFTDLQIGAMGSFAIVGRDMIIRDMIVGAIRQDRYIGRTVANSQLVAALERTPNGSYEAAAVLDGIHRIFSYRSLAAYPLVIISSVADDDALVGFAERERWLVATAVMISFILIGAGALLWRHTTRQEKVEQDLRQSRELLIESQRLGAMGYILTDPNTNHAQISDTLFELMALPRRKSLTLSEIRDLIHPDDRAAYYEERAAGVAKRRDFQFTFRAMRGDGGYAWIRSISHPRFDAHGALVNILHLVQDVSPYKRAEEAVRQSEERFRALIEHSNDMFLIIGPDGGMRYRSPSAKHQFGYDEDEAFGSKLLDRLHPDDHGEAAQVLPPLMATPGGSAAGRWRWAQTDGAWRVIDWTARNATDIAGIEGIIVNARDVTDAAQLQEQLLHSRKMEAVGQLAGGIAHDFNNVLGAVSGFTGFLLQDLPADSEQRRFAERIAAAAERGKTLVQQIFVFSRHRSVEPEPTSIVPIVQETCDLLRASLPASAELEVPSEGQGLVAMVNPAQLSQVLMNLCINARDALGGKPGRVSIGIARVGPGDADYARISGAAPEFGQDRSLMHSGTLDPERAYARITVADTGQGMDAALLARAFEPFFTTKPPGQGTGLGLSVVHGIIMACTGACIVKSRVGEGTDFTFYLPLAFETKEAGKRNSVGPAMRGRERILVIDDDEAVLEMMVLALKRLDYDAIGFSCPVAAIEAFRAEPLRWDAVVADHDMPRIDGVTACRMVKATRPETPFILCTGLGDGETEKKAIAAGADAFFMKPIIPAELAKTLRVLIGVELALA